MSYYSRYYSKNKRREYARTMNEIDDFCADNGITASAGNDSFYFTLNGIHYRVSNHTVEASNKGAYNVEGVQVRELYHPNGREDNVVYITAGKTRIMQIYNDLAAGYKLDKRGNRILEVTTL